jgi:twitching motility protein PilT
MSQSPEKHEKHEKRKTTRLRTNIPFRYYIHSAREEIIKEGKILEISAENVLFDSPEGISIGDRIRFEVTLPTLMDIVRCWGVVTRLDYDEKQAALEFDQMDDVGRKQVLTFLERSDIIRLLETTLEEGASDLHLSVGHKPHIRLGGTLKPLPNHELLTGIMLKKMVYSILSDDQTSVFEKRLELDSSFALSPIVRFRFNVHVQRGNVEIAFRRIESHIRTLEELGLPPVVADLARKRSGLVIVTGATNAGKTTTVSGMVDLINTERSCVIITLEDPIEYVHDFKKGIVKQREVGLDTKSFPIALKHALRQDPDVIVIGEIRDPETMATALSAAETGHLIVATLPAFDSVQAISQIVNMFPVEQQRQARMQLAETLQGMVYQMLLPHADKPWQRVLATEILVVTPAVRNLIREQRLEQIPLVIQTGGGNGMHTIDSSLELLLRRREITQETVRERCRDKKKFGINE